MPEWLTPEMIVDIVVAIATLTTIFFTWKAAANAAESARLSRKQFNLNQEQYDRERKPNILPISDTYIRNKVSINHNFDSDDYISSKYSDMKISLINAGLGTVYSLEASLKVINLSEFANPEQIFNPLAYESLVGSTYTLNFKRTNEGKTLELIHSAPESTAGQYHSKYFAHEHNSHKTILDSKESFLLNISSHTYIILLHYVYIILSHGHTPSKKIRPIFEIHIRYKDEAQLGTDSFTEKKYKVLVKEPKAEIDGTISFRLDYQ